MGTLISASPLMLAIVHSFSSFSCSSRLLAQSLNFDPAFYLETSITSECNSKDCQCYSLMNCVCSVDVQTPLWSLDSMAVLYLCITHHHAGSLQVHFQAKITPFPFSNSTSSHFAWFLGIPWFSAVHWPHELSDKKRYYS